MSLQTTPTGERLQIVLFGKRNAGKSSLLNAVTGQETAIVSDTPGTTTDPVSKAMEILPIGPCMLTDTPGLDDEGELGKKRIEKALRFLHKADVVLLVIDINSLAEEDLGTEKGLPKEEAALVRTIEDKNLPCLIVLNQADRMELSKAEEIRKNIAGKHALSKVLLTSAVKKTGIEELKEALIEKTPFENQKRSIIGDLVEPEEFVVLVVPIDSAAPKGRLILPQQQVIRDLLDHHAAAVVTQVEELEHVLMSLKGQVKLVITDSQAFQEVAKIVPEEIFLTSFSILFARYKGNLDTLVEGVHALKNLKDGDRILIAEGCTHHRQCEDIGTVKIPRLLKSYTGKELVIETSSGAGFPKNLSRYAMVIHCGGCTLPEKEMKHRIEMAEECQVPIVNYGIFLAQVNGILERSVRDI